MRNKRKAVGILVIFLLISGLVYLFLNAGRFIVREDKPVPSDLIVVLMGGGPDRILEAIDLYKAGYSQKILMVENNQPGFELLKERRVSIPRDAYLAKSIGVQMGVPDKAFIILPGNALSTQDEARHIKGYLKSHREIKSMLIVSSRYHTGRAARIFQRAFGGSGDNMRILAIPSRYDTFNENAWWRSREDTKQVVIEHFKLISFYTIDR